MSESDYESEEIIVEDSDGENEIVLEETDEEEMVIEETSSSTFSSELKSIEDIVLKSEQGKLFEMAEKTNTPQKFIFKINGELISAKDKIKNSKNILENYEYFFERNIKIFPKDFVMLFYIANQNKSKKNLIENFNMFSILLGNEEFYIEAFEDYKDKFERTYQIYMDKTLVDYDKFKIFYKKIEKLKPSQDINTITDTVKEYTTKVEIKVTDSDYMFDKYNAEIIFNNMKTTPEFNFIRMKLKGQNLYKFYSGDTSKYPSYIVNNDSIEAEEDTIYIFYKLNIQNIDYSGIIGINLLTSIMTLEYSGQELSLMKEKISQFYPSIKFLETSEKSMTGDFEIEFPNFDETKLYYLTLFDSIVSEFLFIREVASPRSLKENIKYYYVGTDEVRDYTNYSIFFNINRLQGDKYIVSFNSKKHSAKLIKEFIYVMNKLITRYNEQTNDKIPFYGMVTTPYTGINGSGLGGKEEDRNIVETQKYKKKIDNLYLKNKNLFSKNYYARSCTCQKQPIIIPEEDVKDWKNYTFDGKKRNVVLFPPQESTQKVTKDYYVCPDDDYPILTLRQNPDNASEYPLVPCCNISNFPEDLYKDYDKIREKPNTYWASREEYKGKGKGILKTNKILSMDREGYLPENIEKILKEIENNKFIREGVMKNNPSSFFFIFFKIGKEYEKIFDKEKLPSNYINFFNYITGEYGNYNIETKKSYFGKLLNFIGSDKNPGLNFVKNFREIIYQETYNYNTEEIDNIIKDRTREKDSRLFYRLMEFMFCVNVYVFVYDKDTESTYLEIPENDRYHIREIREELPCVLVLKHLRKNKFSVYEVIKTEEVMNETNSKYIFPPKYNRYFKNKIYSENTYYIVENKNMEIRKNPYNNINWGKILRDYSVVSQKINRSGRTFSYNLKYEEDKIMTIFCKPTFPFNAPVSDEIFDAPKKDIVKLFGSDYKKGSEGLWYPLNDFEQGFFIYSSEIGKNEMVCKDYLIILNKNNKVRLYENIKICKRNAHVFTQSVLWLYILEQGVDYQKWSKKYLMKDEKLDKKIFSVNYITIPPRFPKNIKTTVDGIEYLNKYLPRVFEKKMIYLYPELYDHINMYMINYLKKFIGYALKQEVIANYYQNKADFKYNQFNQIIIGQDKFILWKEKNIETNRNKNSIYEQEDMAKTESFFWYNQDVKTAYYVQNNEEQSFIVSFMNSLVWNFEELKYDYYTKPYSIWKNLSVLKEKRTGWNYENLKEFIKTKINKTIYLKDKQECLNYLTQNKIPYQINKEYSYIVYAKINDKIKIVDKYIIDDKGYLEFFKYSEGGYASLMPIN